MRLPPLSPVTTCFSLGFWALLLPLLTGCGEGSGEAEAQAVAGDSVLQEILQSAAEADRATTDGSPRISPQERANRPLDIASMGFNDGSPDAPLKVLELSDFGCGYCRTFHLETYPKLREVYMDGGFVEWKYVPVSIGFPNGLQAAVAGECAGEQDRFAPLRMRLFQDQGTWRGAEDPYPIFARLAGEEGLDVERFNACVQGGWRDARVRDNLRLSGELGVQGTPTFIIDGKPLPGAQPLDLFRDILDVSLRSKGVDPPKR